MEHDEAPRGAPQEAGLSSVKFNRNAKGQMQFEVKVYAETNDPQDVDAAVAKAIAITERLVEQMPWATAR